MGKRLEYVVKILFYIVGMVVILWVSGCGRDQRELVNERTNPVKVTVEAKEGEQGEKGDPGEIGATGEQGVQGDRGDKGRRGDDAKPCYPQNELSRTRHHGDHIDYYYNVLLVCPESSEFIARDVRYHEEL